MYTLLVILMLVAIAFSITGVILLLTVINNFYDDADTWYNNLQQDITREITAVTEMREELDFALSKLPKSKAKPKTPKAESVDLEDISNASC